MDYSELFKLIATSNIPFADFRKLYSAYNNRIAKLGKEDEIGRELAFLLTSASVMITSGPEYDEYSKIFAELQNRQTLGSR